MSLDRFRSVDIRIDKADHYFMSSQFAKGGDYNGRTLVVQITNGGLIESQAGITVNLGWRHESVKNSGLDPFEVVDAAQGIFEISYPREMLNPGRVTAVIQIIDGETITETKNFVIQVEKSPIDETSIVSSNSFTVLQEALIKVNSWNARIDAVEADFIERANNLDAIYPTRLVSVEQQLEQSIAMQSGLLAFKGSDTTANINAKTGMVQGDYWYSTDGLAYFAYTGTAWANVGSSLVELSNIRLGADGITYPTAGEAVRGQLSKIESTLNGIDTTVSNTSLTWVNGLIDGYGNNQVNDARLRTDTFFTSDFADIITANTGYKFIVRVWINNVMQTANDTYMSTFDLRSYDLTYKFKIFVRRDDLAVITVGEASNINFIKKSYTKALDEKIVAQIANVNTSITALDTKTGAQITRLDNVVNTRTTALVNMDKLTLGKQIMTWATTATMSNTASYLGGNASRLVSELYPVKAGDIYKSAYQKKAQVGFIYMLFNSAGAQVAVSTDTVTQVTVAQDGFIIFDFANVNLIPEAIVKVSAIGDFPYVAPYYHNDFAPAPYEATELPLEKIDKTGGYMAIFHDFGVIGDSLASGNMEGYDALGVKVYKDNLDYSWGACIARATGCTNHMFSRGGQYLHDNNWYAEWADDVIATPCTGYIINIGFNDSGWLAEDSARMGSIADINTSDFTLNPNTFYGQYAKMIQLIQSVQPKARIFLCNMEWNSTDTGGISTAIAALAAHFDNCYLLDLKTYAHEPYWGVPNIFKTGDYHKNTLGYQKTAWDIMSYIDYIIRHNMQDFIDVQFIGTEYTLTYP